jgi:predicted TIM-barrel fold metal-dependent hydrolase
MSGSDWPVCTLATDYGATLDLVRSAGDAVLGETAIRTYGLQPR